jgi:hypothetical protein
VELVEAVYRELARPQRWGAEGAHSWSGMESSRLWGAGIGCVGGGRGPAADQGPGGCAGAPTCIGAGVTSIRSSWDGDRAKSSGGFLGGTGRSGRRIFWWHREVGAAEMFGIWPAANQLWMKRHDREIGGAAG